jgi:hypothetical protein
MMLGAMRIIEDPNMVDLVGWDQSRVRSPSRAARRWNTHSKRGRPKRSHKQNIRPIYEAKKEVYRIGNTMFMHPATARQLIAEVDRSSVLNTSPFGRFGI